MTRIFVRSKEGKRITVQQMLEMEPEPEPKPKRRRRSKPKPVEAFAQELSEPVEIPVKERADRFRSPKLPELCQCGDTAYVNDADIGPYCVHCGKPIMTRRVM
jgi:hypothetical protein